MDERLSVATPIGDLTIVASNGAIKRVEWGGTGSDDSFLLRAAAGWIEGYFRGERVPLDLPVAPGGSEIMQRFLAALLEIPFGETRTYGDLADELGISAQAAGQLCGGNPIPILIPCHRVIGAGSLGGFSAPGGIETKVWLLRHEGAAGLLI